MRRDVRVERTQIDRTGGLLRTLAQDDVRIASIGEKPVDRHAIAGGEIERFAFEFHAIGNEFARAVRFARVPRVAEAARGAKQPNFFLADPLLVQECDDLRAGKRFRVEQIAERLDVVDFAERNVARGTW